MATGSRLDAGRLILRTAQRMRMDSPESPTEVSGLLTTRPKWSSDNDLILRYDVIRRTVSRAARRVPSMWEGRVGSFAVGDSLGIGIPIDFGHVTRLGHPVLYQRLR